MPYKKKPYRLKIKIDAFSKEELIETLSEVSKAAKSLGFSTHVTNGMLIEYEEDIVKCSEEEFYASITGGG